MTPVEKLQLNNTVERVLHAPGNTVQNNLEWTFVFDYNMPKEELKEISKEIIITLKQHSTIFQNARLNVVEWKSDSEIIHKNVSMPSIQIGSYFQDYEQQIEEKKIEDLAAALKLFQARAKLIILITKENYQPTDMNKWKENMNPFLFHRLFTICEGICSFFKRI